MAQLQPVWGNGRESSCLRNNCTSSTPPTNKTPQESTSGDSSGGDNTDNDSGGADRGGGGHGGWFHQQWQDGTILIGIGWIMLGLIAVDRLLQYWDRQSADDTVLLVQEETAQKRQEIFAKYWDAPSLYRAQVRVEYAAMGGSHGLKDVRLNDVIEVLEEYVGPGNYYHLCRTRGNTGDNVSTCDEGKPKINMTKKEDPTHTTQEAIKYIGWYPASFLKRIPDEKDSTP